MTKYEELMQEAAEKAVRGYKSWGYESSSQTITVDQIEDAGEYTLAADLRRHGVKGITISVE